MSDLIKAAKALHTIADALEADAYTEWQRETRRPSGEYSPAWARLLELRTWRLELRDIYNTLLDAQAPQDAVGSAE